MLYLQENISAVVLNREDTTSSCLLLQFKCILAEPIEMSSVFIQMEPNYIRT